MIKWGRLLRAVMVCLALLGSYAWFLDHEVPSAAANGYALSLASRTATPRPGATQAQPATTAAAVAAPTAAPTTPPATVQTAPTAEVTPAAAPTETVPPSDTASPPASTPVQSDASATPPGPSATPDTGQPSATPDTGQPSATPDTGQPSATPTLAATPVGTGSPLTPTTTPTQSVVVTATPTDTATFTPAPTGVLTVTVTPTGLHTATPTSTPAITLTATPTPAITLTRTLTPTVRPLLAAAFTAVPPVPTAALPTPAATNAPVPDDPHQAPGALTDSCASCHRMHTAPGQALRSQWPEENLCLSCHGAAGPATNVADTFSVNNTSTAFFKHNVGLTNGVHHAGEDGGAAFGGANRHVECEDCHEAHSAARAPAGAPAVKLEMRQVPGVDPSWTGPGAVAGYTSVGQADREYQVCLKCHSSYTTLPAYQPDGWNGTALVANGLHKLTNTVTNQVRDTRDLALAFSPYNGSFHPVIARGRNQQIPAGSWVGSWSQTKLVYCSDCHNATSTGAQGTGTHGSSLLHLLMGAPQNGGQTNYTTVEASRKNTNQEICFKCHAATTYLSGSGTAANTLFRRGTSNLHTYHMNQNTTCYTCHNSHGSGQKHLINFDRAVVTPNTGFDSESAWFETSTTTAGCNLRCHGTGHSPLSYTR